MRQQWQRQLVVKVLVEMSMPQRCQQHTPVTSDSHVFIFLFFNTLKNKTKQKHNKGRQTSRTLRLKKADRVLTCEITTAFKSELPSAYKNNKMRFHSRVREYTLLVHICSLQTPLKYERLALFP